MSKPDPNAMFDQCDRALGAALRRQVNAHPRAARALAVASDDMSLAFRVLVALMIVWRPTRRRGVRALVAAVLAALLAKRLRDDIARPRPGGRSEGGMPSRHAAAAVAIASVISDRRRGVGLPLAIVTAVGLAGRVSTGAHDPADVVAGALVGRSVADLVVWVGSPLWRRRARRARAAT